MIFHLMPLCLENTLYDFNHLKFVETYFTVLYVIHVQRSTCAWKEQIIQKGCVQCVSIRSNLLFVSFKSSISWIFHLLLLSIILKGVLISHVVVNLAIFLLFLCISACVIRTCATGYLSSYARWTEHCTVVLWFLHL